MAEHVHDWNREGIVWFCTTPGCKYIKGAPIKAPISYPVTTLELKYSRAIKILKYMLYEFGDETKEPEKTELIAVCSMEADDVREE